MSEPYQSSERSSITAGKPARAAWRKEGLQACRVIPLTACLIVLSIVCVDAATWNRAYVRSLPDSAFAIIERTQDGRRFRRLPHHDASGALDLPHLCNALARLPQVAWRDPAHRAAAQGHLNAHRKEIGAGACRPRARHIP